MPLLEADNVETVVKVGATAAKIAYEAITDQNEQNTIEKVMSLYSKYLKGVSSGNSPQVNLPAPFESKGSPKASYYMSQSLKVDSLKIKVRSDGSYEYREKLVRAANELNEYFKLRLEGIFLLKDKPSDAISTTLNYVHYLLINCMQDFTGKPEEVNVLAGLKAFLGEFSKMPNARRRQDFVAGALVYLDAAEKHLMQLSHNLSAQQRFELMHGHAKGAAENALKLACMLMTGVDKHSAISIADPADLANGIIRRQHSSLSAMQIASSMIMGDHPYHYRFKSVAAMFQSTEMQLVPGMNDDEDTRSKRAGGFAKMRWCLKPYQTSDLVVNPKSVKLNIVAIDSEEKAERLQSIDALLDLAGMYTQFASLSRTVALHAGMPGSLVIYNEKLYEKLYATLAELSRKINEKAKEAEFQLQAIRSYKGSQSAYKGLAIYKALDDFDQSRNALAYEYQSVTKSSTENYHELVKEDKDIEQKLNENIEVLRAQYSLELPEYTTTQIGKVRSLNKLLDLQFNSSVSEVKLTGSDKSQLIGLIKKCFGHLVDQLTGEFSLASLAEIEDFKRASPDLRAIVKKKLGKKGEKFCKKFLTSVQGTFGVFAAYEASVEAQVDDSIASKSEELAPGDELQFSESEAQDELKRLREELESLKSALNMVAEQNMQRQGTSEGLSENVVAVELKEGQGQVTASHGKSPRLTPEEKRQLYLNGGSAKGSEESYDKDNSLSLKRYKKIKQECGCGVGANIVFILRDGKRRFTAWNERSLANRIIDGYLDKGQAYMKSSRVSICQDIIKSEIRILGIEEDYPKLVGAVEAWIKNTHDMSTAYKFSRCDFVRAAQLIDGLLTSRVCKCDGRWLTIPEAVEEGIRDDVLHQVLLKLDGKTELRPENADDYDAYLFTALQGGGKINSGVKFDHVVSEAL
ncbi:hypothetical protein Psal006b_01107 [Piscirickettsia salmonis]|uniref:Uncharacterized protein n=2 Tax=Piscirickettsia salmonis TaxID=1238 RepID=A0A1L6TCZ9_PISSA|nr:hypothetical protein [Piscirickettsia salmonis]AKP74334.1 hypothetical protein PSLF89_2750 [Piscirickettsia salmonis LF-89 = ATCC VR-1361]ALB23276.1 hypothetical protein KU39_2096 [Piscirickettsia salmonis]ALY03182.1 hypothetical protein AWE47_10300 [Piscirickettsia salmonis]AMA42745.1 hypothetical protein AWJ11_10515 [Piscirickettsia salmonis]AOS35217.1 hypothetical protein AVM72_07655 [Piscirickettsia salmonis]